ncbi:MAG TPA: alpha-L-fucosidase [Paludibacter sp.]
MKIISNKTLFRLVILVCIFFSSINAIAQAPVFDTIQGPFKASWTSLGQYQAPEWYRDAKFGIWAHWGPQCEPEDGDWYARNMYIEGSSQNLFHVQKYGHPSVFGFKDVINEWKADQWDPEYLVNLYKSCGAKYFVGMGVHHDNFDLWNSTYQPWNSVNLGPKKDIIGGWAAAAQKAGLRFGVTIHARSAWTWYEPAQLSDTIGPMAGIPYDGKLTKADGVGKWWEGYDPQDLYCQNHKPSIYARDRTLQQQYPGDSMSYEFKQKFYNRIMEVATKYKPDLMYFDDSKLPIGTIGINESYGLNFVSNFYNANIARNGGVNNAVINTKALVGKEIECIVNDLEVGVEKDINPIPWQADACIGGWHYKTGLSYKTADQVIHALVDVVSKNGNLLLNIPVRGNGTIDSNELNVVNGIGAWLKINGNAIYGTRPWVKFGEGPSLLDNTVNSKGEQPLWRTIAYSSTDIRFTTKKDTLFAIGMAWPIRGTAIIKSLGKLSPKVKGNITKVTMLGVNGDLNFTQTDTTLLVVVPTQKPSTIAYVLKIEGLDLSIPEVVNAPTTVFSDDFFRTDVSPGGNPATTYTLKNTGTGILALGTARLTMSGPAEGTAGTPGRYFVSGNLSDFDEPFKTILKENKTDSLVWTFNMRTSYNNSLGGFNDSSRGFATILAADSPDLASASGYAVVMGGEGSGSLARYRLVKFTGGLINNTNLTPLINGQTLGTTTSDWRSYVSMKVKYEPKTDTWSFYDRKDASWGDASINTEYVFAGSKVDSTYTQSPMSSFGFMLNYPATVTIITGYFYNFKVSMSPLTITGLGRVYVNNCIIRDNKTGFSVSAKQAKIKVFDVTGRTVVDKYIDGTENIYLDSKGMYLIRVENNEGLNIVKHLFR